MRRIIAAAVAFPLLTVILAFPAAAQVSLWSEGTAAPATSDATNVLRPAKARNFQVHDIIHIIVIVAAESTTDEQMDLEKKSDSNQLSINDYIKLYQGGSLVPYLEGHSPENLKFDVTGEKKFSGNGTADRQDSLRTRLAAEIVEIKPNGNLVVEAKSRFTKSREKTIITLVGTVRPQDVAPDNSVFSYNIADVDINYESSGPVTDANRRGWFLKLLDKIWPF